MPGTEVELRYLSQLAKFDNEKLKLNMELGLVGAGICITKELKVLKTEEELKLIGAGIGVNISNTKELRVMSFREAMKSKDADKWNEEVVEEKEQFDKYNVVMIMK